MLSLITFLLEDFGVVLLLHRISNRNPESTSNLQGDFYARRPKNAA
jgi:hypothetical protein